ncbi:MAG: amidohydrolase family protein [Gemmatimonadetes bacterium]|nr:amidohydrolase family protein [Gemmatimonadota bacterium]
MHRTQLPKLVLLLALTVVGLVADAQGQDVDILIRGARILDGSGSPDFRGDIAIRGDRIVAIGRLGTMSAGRVIDADGLFVAPGFIDMHSHADRAFASDDLELRRAPNLVMQGITTVVFGPDGRNPAWPMADEMAAYRTLGTALNVVPMVGHGTVRGQVMGDDYERPATAREIEQMQELVREGMEAGAWGLGAGPEYRPGRFSTTEELIALAKVVAEYDGFYYAHQRSQSPLPLWQTPSIAQGWRLTGTDGMRETIRIGREAGIRVVGSHIKAKGPTSWGQSAVDVLMIERARTDGVQVYLDQYPYETFGGGPVGVIPNWGYAPPGSDRSGGNDDPRWNRNDLLSNPRENLRRNLDDPETAKALLGDIAYVLDLQGGADRHIIVVAPGDPSLVGQTLADVAAARDKTPIETLIEFALRGDARLRSGVLFRPLAGHRFDVDNYMRQEYTATSTDGGVSLSTRPGQHPRYYGAFPRKIAYYVKERGVITLPFAVRSSTGLSAQIVGLTDRGYVREGYKADLVIFDYERIDDRATIMEPDLEPEGIEFVFVNGVATVDAGRRTGALPGQVLSRKDADSADDR